MKKLLLIYVLLIFVCHFVKAQNEVIYESISIGKQIWMTKNLDVDRFKNGDIIPEAKTNDEWEKAGKKRQPAWCYSNNDAGNSNTCGKLYNWYAISDSRGLAPEGWHIPNGDEWNQLIGQFGNNHTFPENIKRTNLFPDKFCGMRNSFGEFHNNSSEFWKNNLDAANNISLSELGIYPYICKDKSCKGSGYNVRCLKD